MSINKEKIKKNEHKLQGVVKQIKNNFSDPKTKSFFKNYIDIFKVSLSDNGKFYFQQAFKNYTCNTLNDIPGESIEIYKT